MLQRNLTISPVLSLYKASLDILQPGPKPTFLVDTLTVRHVVHIFSLRISANSPLPSPGQNLRAQPPSGAGEFLEPFAGEEFYSKGLQTIKVGLGGRSMVSSREVRIQPPL